jgi:hypothetical protein
MSSGEEPNGNGRKDFTRILIAAVIAAWGVVVMAGAGWIGSIQSQTNATGLTLANLAVILAKLEVKVEVLSRDNADLRLKFEAMERANAALWRSGERRP